MVYKDVSYLFTGDMEKENEDKRTWPKTDILKVAHHGSKTSSSAKFLIHLTFLSLPWNISLISSRAR